MTFIAARPVDLGDIARLILQQGSRVILLKGELGAGKTELVRAFCRELGSTDEISSPTFALVNEYRDRQNSPIYHIDLYRLENIEAVLGIGIEHYLHSGAWCFIEWPEVISPILTGAVLTVSLEVLPDDRRRIVILTQNM